MIKISIITATYNLILSKREKYFKEMFQSVCLQTYDNIEHVIIDGASSDGTLDLINDIIEAQSVRPKVKIYSEPDTGIYNAFNKGIHYSTGDYIIFLNSDDYFLRKDALQLLVNCIINETIGFVCAGVKIKKKMEVMLFQ